MEINYEFVPEYESFERKKKSDILSYAGKLLEIVGSRTLVLMMMISLLFWSVLVV